MFTHQITSFRSAEELMRDNMLVKHYAGSHSYGTSTPESDVDFRGVFCGDPVNILTPFFPVRECEDQTEEDTKLYELAHFMKLCLDCNPNIVETLWVDMDDIVVNTAAYMTLREHKHKLLSSKIAHTTCGYAFAQLKRIRGHNKWINNPQPVDSPKPYEFLSVVQWFGKTKNLNVNLPVYRLHHRLVPYGSNTYGVYPMSHCNLWDDNGGLNDQFEEGDRDDLGSPLMVVKWNKEQYKLAKEKHGQYWSWKENRNEARGTLEEQFGYDCYSDDTEFLTDSGWKLYDDVEESDTLATFDQETHKVYFQEPIERIDSKFSGNMYHFTGHHTDSFVTSNHYMYIRPYSRTTKTEGKWRLNRAAELPETFDTLTTIVPKSNRQKLPNGFPETELTTLNLLRLMGWYISDGTMNFSPSGNVKSLKISQSKLQSKLTQTLTRLRNNGSLSCKHYKYEPTGISNHPENVWTFPKEISTVVYKHCGHGSKNKRIPQWCFELTKREMTTFIVALLQGDGSQRDHQHHTYVYYSINKGLADDVQRLALLCGFETSLYGPYDMGMFHVHINMRPTTRRTTRSRVNKIKVENKRVVCFMVKNHTLITRRNGQIGFHGNTKHAMHLVRLLRMGVEALRDGEIVVKRPDAEELLAIRNGAWKYEDVVAYAEKMDKEVREVWYKKTNLPKKPDLKFAARLLMEVQEIVWDEQAGKTV